MNANGVIDMVTPIVFSMHTIALFLALVRLVRGPSLPDRAVALDLIAVVNVGIIAVYAINTNQSVLLDAAIVVGLISFLGGVAYAQYIERRARRG